MLQRVKFLLMICIFIFIASDVTAKKKDTSKLISMVNDNFLDIEKKKQNKNKLHINEKYWMITKELYCLACQAFTKETLLELRGK